MKKKLSNNKGFSLVELIIVIAIMAVLIGVLAPQYMKYVERSRLTADNDMIDSVRKACETAVADPNSQITNGFTISFSTSGNVAANDSQANTEVGAIVGLDGSSNLEGTQLKSKTYAQAGSSLPVISVTLTDKDGDGVVDPEVTVSGLK